MKAPKTNYGVSSISIEVDLQGFNPALWRALFGPLGWLAYEFSDIDPHWYLNGAFR